MDLTQDESQLMEFTDFFYATGKRLDTQILKHNELFTENIYQNDSETKICLLCQARFSVTNRRHHCRMCGLIFCQECSFITTFKSKSENCEAINVKKERICLTCNYAMHTELYKGSVEQMLNYKQFKRFIFTLENRNVIVLANTYRAIGNLLVEDADRDVLTEKTPELLKQIIDYIYKIADSQDLGLQIKTILFHSSFVVLCNFTQTYMLKNITFLKNIFNLEVVAKIFKLGDSKLKIRICQLFLNLSQDDEYCQQISEIDQLDNFLVNQIIQKYQQDQIQNQVVLINLITNLSKINKKFCKKVLNNDNQTQFLKKLFKQLFQSDEVLTNCTILRYFTSLLNYQFSRKLICQHSRYDLFGLLEKSLDALINNKFTQIGLFLFYAGFITNADQSELFEILEPKIFKFVFNTDNRYLYKEKKEEYCEKLKFLNFLVKSNPKRADKYFSQNLRLLNFIKQMFANTDILKVGKSLESFEIYPTFVQIKLIELNEEEIEKDKLENKEMQLQNEEESSENEHSDSNSENSDNQKQSIKNSTNQKNELSDDSNDFFTLKQKKKALQQIGPKYDDLRQNKDLRKEVMLEQELQIDREESEKEENLDKLSLSKQSFQSEKSDTKKTKSRANSMSLAESTKKPLGQSRLNQQNNTLKSDEW